MTNKKPTLKYFQMFRRKCFVYEYEHLSKFVAKEDEEIFFGYSLESKAYNIKRF